MNKTIDKNKSNQTRIKKNTCHTQTNYQKHNKSNKVSKGTNKQRKIKFANIQS